MVKLYKCSFYLLFITLLGISTAASAQQELADYRGQENSNISYQTVSQQLLEKRISLKVEDMSVRQVLNKIQNQIGAQIVYTEDLLDSKPHVTLHVEEQKLFDILDLISHQTGLKYWATGSFIIMRGRELPEQVETVSGQVTDAASGESLPGVNVIIKGTTTGTSTDADGRYELTVESLQDTLVFSFIGYRKKEVPINNQTELNVNLQPETVTGDELVVIGYGAVEKSDLTGSVSSLNADDLNPLSANTSIDQMMLGRSAGVKITQTSSEPGGGLSIRVRGASSINAGNEPLFVIDGVPIDNSPLLSGGGAAGIGNDPNPRNPLNALNPSDIESIEILKDASATAIYGSRGASGVILVTTKQGVSGRVNANYDFSFGTQIPNKIDVLSTGEYIGVMNGISQDQGNGPVFTESEINKIEGIDWQDEIYRNAPLSSHNLSFGGGSDNVTYYASMNYFNQEGAVKNSGIDKYIARLNINSDLGEDTNLGININTSLVHDNNNVDGVNINEAAGPIYSSLLFDPTLPIYDDSGEFYVSPDLTINNPLSLIEGISSTNETNRTFGNVFLEHNFTNNLSAKINFGSDRQTSRRDIYNSTLTFNGAARGGIADIVSLERSNILLEYTMTYDRQIAENHSLNILGGTTYQNFTNRSFGGNISDFPSDVLGTNNLGLGDTDNDGLGSNKVENTLLSYLGRVNYSIYDKYMLTASFRADGSSRFGENNKYGFFPSFALAWKLADEEFIPQSVDELKLRTSWGQTGNQEIGNYASIPTFTASPPVVLNESLVTGTSPSRIANPDLKWETTEQFNVGLDVGVFDDRLQGTVDFFIKTTKDMLINMPLSQATGFGSILSNVGSMENKGLEFMINSVNISKRDFSWSSTLNFSTVINKVVDLGGENEIITGGLQAIGSTTIIREGAPVNTYYGYDVIGIFQTGDEIANSPQPNAQPGYPIFRDVDGDNNITPEDRTIIGSPFPDYIFGISNSLSYKNFDLDFFIQGQQGADLLNINMIESMYPSNFRRNRIAEPALNRWTSENQNTKWPSGVEPSAYGGSKVNTLALQDASYIRLKNVQLSYNIPVDRIPYLESAQIRLTGKNLYTITDYTGFDPEANAFGRSNVRVDYNGYPLARTLLVGANLRF